MSESHKVTLLGQFEPRELAQFAGVLAPTQDAAVDWLYRVCGVTADLWKSADNLVMPLSAILTDRVFSEVTATTETLTSRQLWVIFTDLGAYAESGATSHLNNIHSIDNLARYTLHDIGTRLVVALLAHLVSKSRSGKARGGS